VHQDLIRGDGRQVSEQRGREGMAGEQVLRVILVKQLGGFSYDELAFHLADSLSYRAFCRMDIGHAIPNKKTLQRNVKKVEAITLERINVLLVERAFTAKIEDDNKIRVDCTVMETNIHGRTRTGSACAWCAGDAASALTSRRSSRSGALAARSR
jgi:IS5 family transposase